MYVFLCCILFSGLYKVSHKKVEHTCLMETFSRGFDDHKSLEGESLLRSPIIFNFNESARNISPLFL